MPSPLMSQRVPGRARHPQRLPAVLGAHQARTTRLPNSRRSRRPSSHPSLRLRGPRRPSRHLPRRTQAARQNTFPELPTPARPPPCRQSRREAGLGTTCITARRHNGHPNTLVPETRHSSALYPHCSPSPRTLYRRPTAPLLRRQVRAHTRPTCRHTGIGLGMKDDEPCNSNTVTPWLL